MSGELEFTDWLKLRFPRGCPTSFDIDDVEMAFRAGKSIGATQPQAPQGAVTELTSEQIDKAYRDVWSTVPHANRLTAFAHAIYALAAPKTETPEGEI